MQWNRANFSYVSTLIVVIISSVIFSGCRGGKASSILYWGKLPKEKQLDHLKRIGVKSLISVRTNPTNSLRAAAEKRGLRFFHVKTGVVLPPGHSEIEQFVRILNDPDNRPAYLFCVGGRDRTAFYVSLYRMTFEGWNATQASSELKAHKLRRGWPTFWLYDDTLEKEETFIHQLVEELNCSQIETQISDGPCPCIRIDGTERSWKSVADNLELREKEIRAETPGVLNDSRVSTLSHEGRKSADNEKERRTRTRMSKGSAANET